MKRAVYPGSFDPPTNGHLDIIERAAKLFDELIVAAAINYEKEPLFNQEERVEMLKEITRHLPQVKVDSFSGLLVNYLKKKDCHIIVKGLRALSDFENEFQMALINSKLWKEVETVFLITSAENSFLSSRIVKEVASLGGSVGDLVPKYVEKKLQDKFKKGG